MKYKLSPIHLGQSTKGFLFAACLIFFWQCAHAQATVDTQGSSENMFFKVEWEFDLENGTGLYQFRLQDPDDFNIYGGNFYLRIPSNFIKIETMTIDGVPQFGLSGLSAGLSEPAIPGQYKYPAAINLTQPLAQIEITFPTENVGLYETSMTYTGHPIIDSNWPVYPQGTISALQALGSPGWPEQVSGITRKVWELRGNLTMDFVTIQAIPEPTTITTLGLGAIIASTLRRKNDKKTKI